MSTTKQKPAKDDVAYRAISGWAIAALVLGLLSGVALVGPVLWSVPLAAILAAGIAMWRINRSSGELVGWNLAVLGLLLAIVFGVAAPTRIAVRRHWLETRGGIFADEFVELLKEGKGFGAYQLLQPPLMRKPFDADPETSLHDDSHPDDARPKERYEKYLTTDPAKTLLAAKDQARVELVEISATGGDEYGNDIVSARYRVKATIDGQEHSFIVHFTLLRGTDSSGHEFWRIVGLNLE